MSDRDYAMTGEVDNDRIMSICVAVRMIEGVREAYIGLSKDGYHACLFINGVKKGERDFCITLTPEVVNSGVLNMVREKLNQS